MKALLCFGFFIISMLAYSQDKFLVIQKNNSEFTKEIKENKRIKIETSDGLKHVGRFTIIDSTSIMIAEKVILLEDIVKMKRKSLFGTIANPVFIVYGSFVFIGGALIAGTGGLGVLVGGSFMIASIPMILIPAISNNHSSKKWKYSIKIE